MTGNENLIEDGREFMWSTSRQEQQLMGALAMQETMETHVTLPEVSVDRQVFIVEREPNKMYGVFCSDDRGATEASAKSLAEKYGISGEEFLRVYGGLPGIARRLAVTIAAQYGPESLARYGTSFTDFAREVKARIERTSQVKLGTHSAESNEGNSTSLDMQSEKGLGCAYCLLLGAVTCGCQPGSDLEPMAREEHRMLFGDDNLVEPVAAGNDAVEKQFFAEEKDAFALTRDDLTKLDSPVMILAGSHGKAADVEVVFQLDPAKVSRPAAATVAGKPFYNIDAVAEAEMIIKAFPELKLNPKVHLAVSLDDARVVRRALAASEGLQASDLKLVRNGDIEQAITYLEAIAA